MPQNWKIKSKDAFKAHKNITQAKDYGTEYFRGKFTCMRRVFINLYEEHNPGDDEDNDEVDESEDDEEEVSDDESEDEEEDE